jgi:hypothetical protein
MVSRSLIRHSRVLDEHQAVRFHKQVLAVEAVRGEPLHERMQGAYPLTPEEVARLFREESD